jgi:muramoyltetrapeptide carboxypeptidase
MITPPYLHSDGSEGDAIALVAASRFIEQVDLERAVAFLKQLEFEVVCGPNILKRNHQFAGTDLERAADVNWALEQKEVKAIIFFRGGYGAAKIVDLINWDLLQKQPKWICGYSDVTAIHQHIQSLGMQSLHSTMPVHLNQTDEESIMSFHAMIEVLKGEPVEYYLGSENENHPTVKGEIIGGNLSVLYSTLGSKSDTKWDGKILFLEDLDEYLYHIDRMMNALSRAGRLDKLTALIAGSFTDMNDNTVPFGKDAIEILEEYAKKHNIPFFFEFPAGHQKLNIPVRLGAEVTIENGVMVYI